MSFPIRCSAAICCSAGLCLAACLLGTAPVQAAPPAASAPAASAPAASLRALAFPVPAIHVLVSAAKSASPKLASLRLVFQMPAAGTQPQPLAWAARTDLRVRLEPGSGNALVESADGLLYTFRPDASGHYQPVTGEARLSHSVGRSGDGFVLTTRAGVRYDFMRFDLSGPALSGSASMGQGPQWLLIRLGNESGQSAQQTLEQSAQQTLEQSAQQTVELTRDRNGSLVSLRSGSGEAVFFSYDVAQRLVSARDGQGRVWTVNAKGQWVSAPAASSTSAASRVSSPAQP